LHDFYHRFINGRIYRIGFRYIDAFIAVSEYMQNALRKDGIESIHIPNATELFAYTPIDLMSQELLFVGRLEDTKGVQFIMKAMPNILSIFPDARLSIAGRGSYEERLRELAKELKIENSVRFMGHLSRDELQSAYNTSSLVIMPSVWPESFGLVGIEAMSAGRPVMATNIGGTSDWLRDNHAGFAIGVENAEEISEKVIAYLQDPNLRTQMSENARNASKPHSFIL
jgi:glycosyltransferase involved in cell wall biosynthesis